ncbi:MAG: alginate lyase family protein, partial [Gammaproteobacteria bacterium]|nr:alginate lyase family protein [Gammaproteobacteria bacterium]
IGLPSEKDKIFRRWLGEVRHKNLANRTLISTHEDRPNNWGTHAGASRAAAAVYLGDTADLQRTAQVFKGYLGDRSSYAGFKFGELSWQCNPDKPVGVNPKDCEKNGLSIDGVLPDDQRRCGPFSSPPCKTNYAWEGLQGAIVQAVILHHAGYDTFEWEDRALLRAYQWLYNEVGYPAEGDDTWQLPLVDYFYGTHFWNGKKTRPGKNMGWTEWTHPKRAPSQ